MNYGYSQQMMGGFGRYAPQSQPHQAPQIQTPQGTPALGRYAQGLDKQYGQIQFLKEQGFTDEEIQKKFGMNPNMEQGMLGQYGGLLNQRDAMKGQLQQDMISGIESGAKFLGKSL